MKPSELYGAEYAAYQIRRNPLRKAVRRFYLRNILRHVEGRTLDLGCGCGELLARLPAGSLGLDVNRAAVEHCVSSGLDAKCYDPGEDRYEFRGLPAGTYGTLTMVHVLEHLLDPGDILEQIGRSCARLGMKRIIIVVPGLKGFRHDRTHRSYVDRDFFEGHSGIGGFTLSYGRYFPLNCRWAGNFFKHNELVVRYDRGR